MFTLNPSSGNQTCNYVGMVEDMAKKSGFANGAFLLVVAFVWIVFDTPALGLIFGFIAAGTVGSARESSPPDDDRLNPPPNCGRCRWV